MRGRRKREVQASEQEQGVKTEEMNNSGGREGNKERGKGGAESEKGRGREKDRNETGAKRYRMFEAACLTLKHKLNKAAEP